MLQSGLDGRVGRAEARVRELEAQREALQSHHVLQVCWSAARVRS